jgi:uncharacterized protein (DUF58 family)
MTYKLMQMAPLKGSFMLTAILGLTISMIYVYPTNPKWGAAFTLVFLLMFIASLINMTYAPIGDELQIDVRRLKKKKRK